MRPSFEKLVRPQNSSIRCFDRRTVEQPATWHYHPEIELTFVERGTGTRFVGDHIGNYGDGDMVLLGPDLPHHWASEVYRDKPYDRHSAIVVQFDPALLGEQFLTAPEVAAIARLLERSKRGIRFVGSARHAAAKLVKAMLIDDAFERLVGLLRALHVLARATEVELLASEGYSPSLRFGAQSRLNEVCQYIHDHLTDPDLNQAQLAGVADMHLASFSRFFKKGTERTVTDYVNELRIGLASRQLVETDASVLDICGSVGYRSVSNFNRRFREYRSMSPRQYRKQYRAHGVGVV